MEMKISILNFLKSLLGFRPQSTMFFRLKSEHNPDLNDWRRENMGTCEQNSASLDLEAAV